jgi:hypothetical protein
MNKPQLSDLRTAARELIRVLDRMMQSDPDLRPANDPVEPTHMTIATFARREAVSVATVRRWRDRGMPIRKTGNVIRIPVAEAEAWLAQH